MNVGHSTTIAHRLAISDSEMASNSSATSRYRLHQLRDHSVDFEEEIEEERNRRYDTSDRHTSLRPTDLYAVIL